MNLRWEIRRVSTPERIFNKIKEMAQPVGVVLFGADCDFKNEVKRTTWESLCTAYCFPNAPGTAELVNALKDNSMVIVTLNSDESSTHGLRHELVKVMRNAGAETVVGIYAKAKKKPIPFGKATISAAKDRRVNQQIDAIEQSNPTADGLDYFIVVEEEER